MAALPVYGLGPEWDGPRVIVDFLLSGDVVEGVCMRHGGNVWGAGSQLIVKTEKPGEGYGGSPLEVVAEYLWRKEDGSEWLPRLEGEDLEILERVRSEPSRIRIDGEQVPARLVRDGKEWVAGAIYQGLFITLVGHDFSPEDVELFRMSEADWPRQPREAPPL